MNTSDDWSRKLGNAGLTIGICSTISLTFIKLHYLFVFLPEHYGSFSNIFRQKTQINFEPGLSYLQTTTGMVLVTLALSGILLGFGMMHISTIIARQEQKEDLKQWLKENNIEQSPEQSITKKRNPKKHRKLKEQKPKK